MTILLENLDYGRFKENCNPQGYIDEPFNGYERELIIEI